MNFGFRWYGPEDSIPLAYIRQIPCISTVVAACYGVPAGQLWPEEEIAALSARCAEHGLAFTVAEGLGVHEDIKLGLPGREGRIETYVENLRRLARCGVTTVCYNFMPLFGWVRTDLDRPLPDGSRTVAFRRAELDALDPAKAELRLPGWNFSAGPGEAGALLEQYRALGRAGMWKNLTYFLQAVVPEAERLGVRLAIHPDDPPLPVFGLPRIVSSLEDLLRLTAIVDSPSNGVTLCTGSLGSGRDNDVAAIADRLAADGKIPFVHARNVLWEAGADFSESAHPSACGSLDMAAILAALHRRGFDGVIRADHGRMVWGERGRPGYGLYDRAMGVSYLAGLWEALEHLS